MTIKSHPVYLEAFKAYADCEPLFGRFAEGTANHDNEEFNVAYEHAMDKRQLKWRASQAVDKQTAVLIMQDIVPGYNNFEPNLLNNLPDDCKITLAREGSVCIYVTPGNTNITDNQSLRKQLKYDEFDILKEQTYNIKHQESLGTIYEGLYKNCGGYAGEIRIWWD